MRLWKNSLLFYLGGMGYTGLELLFRGFTHGSMFVLGGLCFVIIGKLRFLKTLWVRLVAAAGIVTVLELLCGLAVNRNYQVWDYRNLPLNYRGQICLTFSLLWIPVSLAAILLYNGLDKAIGLTFASNRVK